MLYQYSVCKIDVEMKCVDTLGEKLLHCIKQPRLAYVSALALL